MMIPFWSIAGTSDKTTSIDVEEIAVALTLVGGEAGTKITDIYNHILNVYSFNLLSSSVVSFTTSLYGPEPMMVYALTLI